MLHQVSVSFKNKEDLPCVFNTNVSSISDILNHIRQNFKKPIQSVEITKIDNNIYKCVNCDWQGLDSDKKRVVLNVFINGICCPKCNKGVFKIINN